MGRLSSTEANKKLERLELRKQKLEQELQAAREEADKAIMFEEEAFDIGVDFLNIAEISDKKQFLNWFEQNIDQISGIKKRQNALTETKHKSNTQEDTNTNKHNGEVV